MKIYKCDKCGGSCLQPKDWMHMYCTDFGSIDFCLRCTQELIIEGIKSTNLVTTVKDKEITIDN
jgi:hypothetical protein